MEKTKIKGLIAATVTPMEKNGDINLTAIDAYAEHLIKLGVAGVFVCGTTGESLFLDTEERKKVAEAWIMSAVPVTGYHRSWLFTPVSSGRMLSLLWGPVFYNLTG